MKKIFLMTFLVFTMMMSVAFADEVKTETTEETSAGYEYTSQLYGFKIVCPAEPKVVVNPYPDVKQRGELLIFAVTPDGQDVAYGYMIQFDAFDDKAVPDFNKARKKTIEEYIEKLKTMNAYSDASLEQINKENKGVLAVAAKEIEIKNDAGEVEDVAVATNENVMAFFRAKSGRCISIQLIATTVTEEIMRNFRKSLSTYQDATELAMGNKK